MALQQLMQPQRGSRAQSGDSLQLLQVTQSTVTNTGQGSFGSPAGTQVSSSCLSALYPQLSGEEEAASSEHWAAVAMHHWHQNTELREEKEELMRQLASAKDDNEKLEEEVTRLRELEEAIEANEFTPLARLTNERDQLILETERVRQQCKKLRKECYEMQQVLITLKKECAKVELEMDSRVEHPGDGLRTMSDRSLLSVNSGDITIAVTDSSAPSQSPTLASVLHQQRLERQATKIHKLQRRVLELESNLAENEREYTRERDEFRRLLREQRREMDRQLRGARSSDPLSSPDSSGDRSPAQHPGRSPGSPAGMPMSKPPMPRKPSLVYRINGDHASPHSSPRRLLARRRTSVSFEDCAKPGSMELPVRRSSTRSENSPLHLPFRAAPRSMTESTEPQSCGDPLPVTLGSFGGHSAGSGTGTTSTAPGYSGMDPALGRFSPPSVGGDSVSPLGSPASISPAPSPLASPAGSHRHAGMTPKLPAADFVESQVDDLMKELDRAQSPTGRGARSKAEIIQEIREGLSFWREELRRMQRELRAEKEPHRHLGQVLPPSRRLADQPDSDSPEREKPSAQDEELASLRQKAAGQDAVRAALRDVCTSLRTELRDVKLELAEAKAEAARAAEAPQAGTSPSVPKADPLRQAMREALEGVRKELGDVRQELVAAQTEAAGAQELRCTLKEAQRALTGTRQELQQEREKRSRAAPAPAPSPLTPDPLRKAMREALEGARRELDEVRLKLDGAETAKAKAEGQLAAVRQDASAAASAAEGQLAAAKRELAAARSAAEAARAEAEAQRSEPQGKAAEAPAGLAADPLRQALREALQQAHKERDALSAERERLAAELQGARQEQEQEQRTEQALAAERAAAAARAAERVEAAERGAAVAARQHAAELQAAQEQCDALVVERDELAAALQRAQDPDFQLAEVRRRELANSTEALDLRHRLESALDLGAASAAAHGLREAIAAAEAQRDQAEREAFRLLQAVTALEQAASCLGALQEVAIDLASASPPSALRRAAADCLLLPVPEEGALAACSADELSRAAAAFAADLGAEDAAAVLACAADWAQDPAGIPQAAARAAAESGRLAVQGFLRRLPALLAPAAQPLLPWSPALLARGGTAAPRVERTVAVAGVDPRLRWELATALVAACEGVRLADSVAEAGPQGDAPRTLAARCTVCPSPGAGPFVLRVVELSAGPAAAEALYGQTVHAVAVAGAAPADLSLYIATSAPVCVFASGARPAADAFEFDFQARKRGAEVWRRSMAELRRFLAGVVAAASGVPLSQCPATPPAQAIGSPGRATSSPGSSARLEQQRKDWQQRQASFEESIQRLRSQLAGLQKEGEQA